MHAKPAALIAAIILHFAFSASAKAEEPVFRYDPLISLSVACEGSIGRLELNWDFTKSAIIKEILINGKNELNDTKFLSKDGLATYSKEGIFAITLSPENDQPHFQKEVMILGKSETMACTVTDTYARTFMENFKNGML